MRIFDRPDLDQRAARLAMYITGELAKGKPLLPYEGRLQIHNGVGAYTVRQIDGDTLPNGTQLYVDQDTKQVVIAWPAYVSGAAPISNPGFEDGAVGWELGPGWKIAKENPPTGLWAAGYNNNPGESRISNNARYAVSLGQRTSAQCNVRQGASAEGNAGASVMLEYRDSAGQLVRTVEGNRVMSASKNRVYPSAVTAEAAAGEVTINVASNGIRLRENKILFVDDFAWDHVVPATGINVERVFFLALRIADSAGDSVVWRGVLTVASRPAEYRIIANAGTTIILSTAYKHALPVIELRGRLIRSGLGNTYRNGASLNSALAATTFTASPGVTFIGLNSDGSLGSELPDITNPLPGIGKCAAFSPSGNAVVIGHNGAPNLRAYKVGGSAILEEFDPSSAPSLGRTVEVKFTPDGKFIYVCAEFYPYLTCYRWSDETGFGEQLQPPVEVPGSTVSSICINEGGTHLAALCGATPSCHIYKIGPDGYEERVAAVGSYGQTEGQIAFSDAAGAVAYGKSFGANGVEAFRWDPSTGIGDAYDSPFISDGLGIGAAFSIDGLVLFVGLSSNEGIYAYEWSAGVGATSGPTKYVGSSCSYLIPLD